MNTSESISKLAKAMVNFSAEVKNPPNTADNPFFKSKYAPLADVLNLMRPLLAKHGLTAIQMPGGDGQNVTVKTILLHESGEWIEGDALALRTDKATPQGAGSAVTYGRRYSLSAMLGISSEDEDDGQFASGPPRKRAVAPAKPSAQNPKKGKEELITGPQVEKLFTVAGRKFANKSEAKEALYSKYKVSSTKELTKKQAGEFIDYLDSLPDIEKPVTPEEEG